MKKVKRQPDFKLIELTRQHSQSLSERLLEMAALYDLSRSCNLAIDFNEVLDNSDQLLKQSLGIDDFCIMLLDDASTHLTVFKANRMEDAKAEKVIIQFGEGISGLAVKKKRPILVQDTAKDKRYMKYLGERNDIGSLLSIPLANHNGEIMGVFNIHKPKPNAFTKNDILFFTAAALHIASMLEKVKLFKKIETEAITDSLTGLYSRRYFVNALERKIADGERNKSIFAIVLFDIDYFKSINDSLGHQAGDEALTKIGKVILENTRKGDIAARYGGEEFIVILPNADIDDGVILAEKIRAMIEKEFVLDTLNGAKHVTISAGVSVYPDAAVTAPELIALADKALYRAKSLGRNKVCSCNDASEHFPGDKRRDKRYAVALRKVYMRTEGIKALEINVNGTWEQCSVFDVSSSGFKGIAGFTPSDGISYPCKARSDIFADGESIFMIECRNKTPITGGQYALGFEVTGDDSEWHKCLGKIGR